MLIINIGIISESIPITLFPLDYQSYFLPFHIPSIFINVRYFVHDKIRNFS